MDQQYRHATCLQGQVENGTVSWQGSPGRKEATGRSHCLDLASAAFREEATSINTSSFPISSSDVGDVIILMQDFAY